MTNKLDQVLEVIRKRQREIRTIQDKFSDVCAFESRDAMRGRHDELEFLAEEINRMRMAEGPNATGCNSLAAD